MPAGDPAGYLTPGYINSFFEQNPDYAYNAYNNRWGIGSQADYYRNAFGEVLNSYKGTVGRALESLQEPTGTFADFLSGYDWSGNYRSKAPANRRFAGDRAFSAPVLNWLV